MRCRRPEGRQEPTGGRLWDLAVAEGIFGAHERAQNQSGIDRAHGAWRASGPTRMPITEGRRAPQTECLGRAPGTNAMLGTRRAPGDRRAQGTDGTAPLGPSTRQRAPLAPKGGRRREGAFGPSSRRGRLRRPKEGHGPVPHLNTPLPGACTNCHRR